MNQNDELRDNRKAWNKLYGSFFDQEKWYLQKVKRIEFGNLLVVLLNLCLMSLLHIPQLTIILSVFSLILTILVSVFMYLRLRARDFGELGRRSSFYIKFVPFERLRSTVNELKYKNQKTTKYHDPNWYISVPNANDATRFFVNFYESVYFQFKLMKHFQKKLWKDLTYLVGVILVFLLLIAMDIDDTNIYVIPIFIVIAGFSLKEIWNIIKYWENSNKIQAIFDSLDELGNSEKVEAKWLIFECMRLQQEYSIVMKDIIPVPNEIFMKYRDQLNEECEKSVRKLNPIFQK